MYSRNNIQSFSRFYKINVILQTTIKFVFFTKLKYKPNTTITHLVSEISFKLVTEEAADNWGFGSCLAKSFSSISRSLAAVSTGLAPPNIDCAGTLFGTSVCAASEPTVFGFSMSFGRSDGTEVFSPAVENNYYTKTNIEC